jgi:hypothetical protein
MTCQAFGILDGARRGGLCPEIHHAGERAAAGLDVGAAGTVACLALQLAMAKRPMGIIRPRMFGPKNTGDRRITVAAKAGVGALIAVSRSNPGVVRRAWD